MKLLNLTSDPNNFGGTVKTSALGGGWERSIQIIGTRNSRATSDSRIWETTEVTRDLTFRAAELGCGVVATAAAPSAGVGVKVGVSLVIMHPPLLSDELEDRDHQDDDEQHPGDGRGEAHFVELETLLVQVDHHGGSGVPRASSGEDIRLGEDLEGRDQGSAQRRRRSTA